MKKIPQIFLLKNYSFYFLLLLVILLLSISQIAFEKIKDSKSVLSETTQNKYFVTTVVDGDTFKIDSSGKIQTVRLIAVDAPESKHPTKPKQCYSSEAKSYLSNLIQNKYVTLVKDINVADKDRYGRLLRYTFIDGLHVNEALIKGGYAFEKTYDEKYSYKDTFRSAQKFAMVNKIGLWNVTTCNGDPSSGIKNNDLRAKFKCDCTKTCSQIITCEEAQFQLNSCKCTGRDPNMNKIPCEGLCKLY